MEKEVKNLCHDLILPEGLGSGKQFSLMASKKFRAPAPPRLLAVCVYPFI
jgi:hypothetical protein